jgi:PAS domain S-box-containing protein
MFERPLRPPAGQFGLLPETQAEPKEPGAAREPAQADFRLVMDTIPAIVWSASLDGSDDFFNKGWVEYTNLPVEESKGFGWLKAIHPEDAPALLAKWRTAIRTGTPYESVARVRRFDGEYRWFLSRAVPLRDETGKIIKWYGTNIDIEDRKRAEARVGQAETELRLALDTIPALAWSAGPDGSADFVNRGWIEYTSLSLEDTKGSGWSSRMHPDDRDKFVDKFLKAVAAGTPYEDEGRIRHADGQYRWFLVRGTPFRDESGNIVRWYGTCTDIEDRRRAEEALRDSEKRFRDFSEASADWYWETGPDHRFTFVPVERPEFPDVENRDQIGLARWEIAADFETEPAKWEEHIGVLNSHKPFRNFIYQLRLKDGTTMYAAVSGIPRFDSCGRFLGYRGGACDVTAMVRANQLETSLRQAQVELAHITRLTTLGELTASIAHEVNQPLAGVVGNGAACLRWLSKDPPEFYGEVRASVEAMISDANRASMIIAKIRALAKNSSPQMAPIDINEVVKDAVALVRHELDDHDVALRQELTAYGATVMADRTQLQQVIINLIMNSIDAMEDIAERRREILVQSNLSENRQITLTVRDSGVGVDPGQIEKLFQPFFTTKPKGLGMGLSISRSIIEAHDGNLIMSSDGRTGTTVQVILPLAPARAEST